MHKSTFSGWLCQLLSPVSAASSLLLGTLLALTTPSLAQCGCRDLHLAMLGNRRYQYRTYLVGAYDTTEVSLFLAYAQRRFFAYSQRRFARSHALLHLPQFSKGGFQVEVTDSVTQQHMWLTFSYPGRDALEYFFLFDFAPGRHYQVALEEPGPPPGFDVRVTKWADERGKHWLLLHKK